MDSINLITEQRRNRKNTDHVQKTKQFLTQLPNSDPIRFASVFTAQQFRPFTFEDAKRVWETSTAETVEIVTRLKSLGYVEYNFEAFRLDPANHYGEFVSKMHKFARTDLVHVITFYTENLLLFLLAAACDLIHLEIVFPADSEHLMEAYCESIKNVHILKFSGINLKNTFSANQIAHYANGIKTENPDHFVGVCATTFESLFGPAVVPIQSCSDLEYLLMAATTVVAK